jgi:hypothetical protein
MRIAHFAKGGPARKEVTARCRRLGSDIFATRLFVTSFYCVRARGGSDLDGIGHLANAGPRQCAGERDFAFRRAPLSVIVHIDLPKLSQKRPISNESRFVHKDRL